MRLKKLILIASISTFGVGFTAAACEFHGGFGPQYGMGWSEYDFQQTPMDDEDSAMNDEDKSYTPVKKKAEEKKKRPVFSMSASRASDVAKARLERKSEEDDKRMQKTLLEHTSR